jgi:hypothetical protein
MLLLATPGLLILISCNIFPGNKKIIILKAQLNLFFLPVSY